MQTVPQTGIDEYHPSGRIDYPRFAPLLLATIVVAVIMAFVLCLAEGNFYYFIITPFLVGLPVLAGVFLTIRIGRCRNRPAGAIVGLLLMSLYYFGFWWMSYQLNVVSQGPEAVNYVAEHGGASGLLGYFKFRCRNMVVNSTESGPRHNQRGHNASDAGFAYIFYALELLIIPGAGFMLGRHQSGRVFDESTRQWASYIDVRFGVGEFSTVLDAVRNQDWTKLGGLARLPKVGGTKFLLLRVESFRNSPEAPMYVTLSGANLGNLPAAKAAGAKRTLGVTREFIRQMVVALESAKRLVEALPELGGSNRPPAGTTPASPRVEYADGLRGVLQKSGLSQPKIVGPDFRTDAVTESNAVIGNASRHVRAADLGRSLCLVANPNPGPDLKSAGWMSLKLLGVAVVAIIVGIVLLTVGEDTPQADRPPSVTAINVVGGILVGGGFVGMLMVVVAGESLQKGLLNRRLKQRAGSLLESTTGLPSTVVKIENAKTYHLMKRTPDDICVCVFDHIHRRVLLEGISHRYVILGNDVVKLSRLDGGANTALQLNYRIGGQELALAVIPPGLGRAAAVHSPLFLWLASRAGKKFHRRFLQALNVREP